MHRPFRVRQRHHRWFSIIPSNLHGFRLVQCNVDLFASIYSNDWKIGHSLKPRFNFKWHDNDFTPTLDGCLWVNGWSTACNQATCSLCITVCDVEKKSHSLMCLSHWVAINYETIWLQKRTHAEPHTHIPLINKKKRAPEIRARQMRIEMKPRSASVSFWNSQPDVGTSNCHI